MWITTDKDGTKSLWEKKPERFNKEWLGGGKRILFGEYPIEEAPSFVDQQQWKDSPIQVKFEIKKK